MLTPYHGPHRLSASICVCVALLASSCARGAVGQAGPHFTGERVGALEPATVSTDAMAATAEPTASLPESGIAETRPAAEETAVAPVPDPDSSPIPSSSEPPPIEPAVSEAPAEDPEAISTPASQDIEDSPLSADPDSDVPLVEEPGPLEPSGDTTAATDEQPSDDATAATDEQPSGDTTAATDEQPSGDTTAATDEQPSDDATAATDEQPSDDATAATEVEHAGVGEELPGSGMHLFEPGDESPNRRLVAMYGHPSTGALGVLGEQGPEDAVKRLQAIAEGYGADGSAILPTFEIIATVASASAGADGDYSSVTDHDVIRPWIEAAAANGVYVVLDLQPGRSDFLSQAKLYEEFLRLPHVGLALDPEWRLMPDQVHLRQVGTVDAAEINRVVDWLAGIVREEALPQKLLIVHQFRFSMITNRELIETPPELAVLIHMDGQGSLGAKYNTWNTLTGEPDADRFYWGWKNFYDEDSPMATPEQVLELSPEIVFVSFQ